MNTDMSLQGLFAQHVELEIPPEEAPNVSTEGSVPKKKTELHILYTESLFLTSTHLHFVALEVNQVLSG